MKEYNAYEPGFFETSEKEIAKLPMGWEYSEEKRKENLGTIRRKYGGITNSPIIDMTIRKIPQHLKRSEFDNARLFFVKLENGKLFGKRFNNSQHFKLRR